MSTDPSSVALSYLAAFATADPDAIASHVAADFRNEHTAALGSSCIGATEYRRRLPGFLADFADLSYDVVGVVADDERCAVRYVLRARWQGTTPVEVPGCMWFHVQLGRITHRIDHWDSQVFLRQVDES
ncbi:MAG: nuclear transport factor 2 family protein [Acidimicrobiales bacterium]|nr:nuclear transport factor 2 family protein [Acidimicrobiales bacterium]